MVLFLLLSSLFIEESFCKLSSDELNNLYVTTAEKIYKYDADFNPIARYSSPFGNISELLMVNPFKMVIFCRDYYRIIVLDNQLTPIQSPIFLPDYDILQPKGVAVAADGGIWIYDSYKQQVCYIDFASRQKRNIFSVATLMESGNIITFYEHQQQLYFAIENQGVFVYSKFGNMIARYPLPNLQSLKIEHNIFYYSDHQNCYYLTSLKDTPQIINYPSLGSFSITATTIFYLDNQTVKQHPLSE